MSVATGRASRASTRTPNRRVSSRLGEGRAALAIRGAVCRPARWSWPACGGAVVLSACRGSVGTGATSTTRQRQRLDHVGRPAGRRPPGCRRTGRRTGDGHRRHPDHRGEGERVAIVHVPSGYRSHSAGRPGAQHARQRESQPGSKRRSPEWTQPPTPTTSSSRTRRALIPTAPGSTGTFRACR